ncbi:MAG: hypothetical protein IT376_09850, partial [Polyangiaceae bacterium]|nr:hypothetical protein [Polyangiaceae bacterium]
MARRKALAWLCVGLAFGALACGNEGSETPPPPESTPAPVTGPELEPSEADRPPADPPALRAAQRRGVQRKAGPAYRARASDTARAFEASNPQHAFVARFSEDGVALEGRARDAGEGAGGYRAVLTLERAGCGAAARRVGVAVPQAVEAQGNRIEYRRDASELVEWYENGPLGLEQGFTLAGPRLCEGATGALELELAVRGDLEPRRRDAGELLLVDGDGGARLRVHALHAEDATGRVLPAELAVRGERIALRVDVAGATYPVQIDPLIGVEQTKLLARDASYFEMGERVAVTTGSTAVVGVRSDDTQGSLSGTAYVFVRSGSAWAEQAKFRPSSGTPSQYFGSDVAAQGEDALVGSYGYAASQGAAYVYVRSGTSWSQQALLTASDGAASDWFGYALSLDSSVALVGAYGDDDNGSTSGSAYVFTRSGTTWSQQAKLVASDGAAGDYFGRAVALAVPYALIGAWGDDDKGTNGGSAYVFYRTGTTWAQQAKLAATDGAASSYFGQAVAASTTSVSIGSYGDATSRGAVYVFDRSGTVWSQVAKVVASDGASGDYFGFSVSAFGSRLAVGAYNDDDEGTSSGAAYTFTRSGTTFTQEAKLVPSDGAASDNFGHSVAHRLNDLIVGVPGLDSRGYSSGAAYAYRLAGSSTWILETKALPHDAYGSDYFGRAVGVRGDTAIVGAYADDTGGSTSGMSWVFKRSGTTWSHQARLFPTDYAASQRNGYSVDVGGTDSAVAVVSAFGDQTYRGAAYVFNRIGVSWSQGAKLVASAPADYDYLAHSVAITSAGTTVVAGAYADDVSVTDQGSVYVYTGSGAIWSSQATLVASDPVTGDFLGYAVDVGDNGSAVTVIAGAYGKDNGFTDSGAAYAFTRSGSTWSQQSKFSPTDRQAGDFFGISVGYDADSAVVGAYGVASYTGAAYVYVRSGTSWSQQAKLTASDGVASDYFGRAVTISGNIVAVGAYGDDDLGSSSGSAYIFKRTGTSWAQQSKVTASDGASGDYFGLALALDATTLVSGAYYNNELAASGGAAYVSLILSANGDTCALATECASGNCVDGVCCDAACGNGVTTDCLSCNQTGLLGVCSFLPSTYTCRASAGECDVPDQCTGSASTCPADAKKSNGTACTDDGNPCSTDTCNGSSNTCQHPAGNAGATCRSVAGVCDRAETCTGSSTTCPTDAFEPTTTSCRSAAGECDQVEYCPGNAAVCPSDTKKASGTACADDGNVCSADTCNGSSNDCQHPAGNAGTVCRTAGGECDLAEACTGSSTTCPADAKKASGTACTDDGNACTVDQCNGSSNTCPYTAAPSSTVCRVAAGVCDQAENCTGSSTTCPADSFLGASTVCRSGAGTCDVAENCTGSSAACPADAFVASGSSCRPAAGECDVAETCPGNSASCPSDAKKSNGTACTDDGNACSADSCNGTADTCQHPAGNAGSVCRPAAGECDLQEACTGSSTSCPSDSKRSNGAACTADTNVCTLDQCNGTAVDCQHPAGNAGTVCREANGACDAAEACTGSSTSCPADAFQPSSTVCRSAAGVCDVAENCPGNGTACPADTLRDASYQCGAPSCDSGANEATLASYCTGLATTCPPQQQVSCAPYTCSGAGCGGTCPTVPCLGGYYCDSGVCLAEKANGQSCSTGTQCSSGNCIDGVCCNTTCGSGATTDCQACNVAGSLGTCSNLPSTTTCRGAAGECDQEEKCTGSSSACPSDGKKANGTACTADTSPCTLDQCNGSSNSCQHPAGNAGTECRASTGGCDPAESCTGSSTTCPADALAGAGTECRAAAGACDVAESCTGASAACPADAYAASGTSCRSAAGECDLAETCTGSSTACPSDSKKTSGTSCTDDGNVCTVDQCNGSSSSCQHPAGNAGTVCRGAAGECDVAEACSGTATTCPSDAKKTSGTACTADTNPCTLDQCNG